MTPQRYQRSGLLAIEPHAFLELFFAPSTRGVQCLNGVDVIDVIGPIEQFRSPLFDSYEDIRARVAIACESPSKAIALRMSSPGGDVLGMLETAQAIRDACAAANKPLYAYVDKATSAAYALACAASNITCSSVALVGNIGVINRREDVSLQNAARGLHIQFTTSGTRKAFGNPELPLTTDELESTQGIVDQTAQVFFDFVSRMRGIPADQIKALEAGIFVGESAVTNRLADQVGTFENLIARAASGEIGANMASAYDKARAALQEAAKGDDANAAAAKRALAAMAEGGGGDEEKPAEDEKPAEEKPAGDKAADESEDEKAEAADDDKSKKPAALAATHQLAVQALAEVHSLKVREANREAAAERTQLLASRPDFSTEMRAVLATADMATVRKMVADLPKATASGGGLRASTEQVSGTRGENQGSQDYTPNPHAGIDLDAAMGVNTAYVGVTKRGNSQIFGPQPKPAAAAGGSK